MDAGLFIAFRYLFAKKSHNVINVISAISAAGIAIGTAALILILSVYNGFDGIIRANLSDLSPDLLVTSADGGLFAPEGAGFDRLREDGRIVSFACVLEKNVFVTYGDRQGIARAKGVDRSYEESAPLASHVTAGTFSLHRGELAQVSVGAGMAYDMGINPRFLEHLVLHYPKDGTVNPLLGPSSALGSESLVVGSLFSVSSETDAGLIVVPIEVMRRLVGRGDGGVVSGVELRVSGGVDAARLRDEVSASLGPGFNVEDRYMQNSSLYKMMRYEKLAIFTILLFVVIIVAFNIFGSLSMLVVEKEDDIAMLRAMGARQSFVRRVFRLEGWMVSLCGLVCGLVCGVGLALLQQHFGFIKMPGGFFIQAYPVRLQLSDVVLTAAGVALIGFVIAFLSSSRPGVSSQ